MTHRLLELLQKLTQKLFRQRPRKKRTYVDASVLIAAFRGRSEIAHQALHILTDPGRALVVSEYLRLEVIPKPTFLKRQAEVRFMQAVLDAAAEKVLSSEKLVKQAVELASRYNLSPVDALHVAAAVSAGVSELVTLEKPTKPLCRVREIRVVSLFPKEESSSSEGA